MPGDYGPDAQTIALLQCDRLLMCTDGLWGMVEDETISRILSSMGEPEAACRALIAEANSRGGTDNITAVVVDYG
jgi:protein phosphatase